MGEHRPDYHNLDSISLLCAECEGYWPCRYAAIGDAGAQRSTSAEVGQDAASGSTP